MHARAVGQPGGALLERGGVFLFAEAVLLGVGRHPIEVPVENVEVDEGNGRFEFSQAHGKPGLEGR